MDQFKVISAKDLKPGDIFRWIEGKGRRRDRFEYLERLGILDNYHLRAKVVTFPKRQEFFIGTTFCFSDKNNVELLIK